MNCHICGEPMTDYESLRQDCGGDCLTCMAEVGDQDCMYAAYWIMKSENAKMLDLLRIVRAMPHSHEAIRKVMQYVDGLDDK